MKLHCLPILLLLLLFSLKGNGQPALIKNYPSANITTYQPEATTDVLHPICAGSIIQVPFNSNGVYGYTNVYWAELSDSSGSFANHVDTIGALVSSTAFPSLPKGLVTGQVPFNVPAGCHYYVRVASDTPNYIGTVWGPFCIQHCDIWSDTASSSIKACVQSCYKNPNGFSISLPYKIHNYDNNQHYNTGNKYEVQLLNSQTFAVVATGGTWGSVLDSVSGNITLHTPCGDSLCNVVNVPPGLYYMRLIATNTNQPDSEYGTLNFFTIGYPMDSLQIVPSPNTTTFCINNAPYFYAYPNSVCTNNWSGGSTYTWYYNNIIINGVNQADLGLILNTAGNDNLMVKENNNGCSGPLDTLNIKVEGLPSATIAGPIILCLGDTGVYSVPASGNTYYSWSAKYSHVLDTTSNIAKIAFDTVGSFFVKIIASDSCGMDSNTKHITVKNCVNGLVPISNEEALAHIYPNPNLGEFNITLNQLQNVAIKVTDVLGQIIYTEYYGNISGSITRPINLSGASKGIYLLQVISNSGVINKKVIVQ
jgi:hypothetical protein